MDAITFDFLRSVQRAERDNDGITELPLDFLDQVSDYLSRKRKLSMTLDFREFQNAKNIVDDILDRRESKLMRLAAFSSSSNITVPNLLIHERKLFEETRSAVKSYREKIQTMLDRDGGELTESKEDSESDEVKIKHSEKEVYHDTEVLKVKPTKEDLTDSKGSNIVLVSVKFDIPAFLGSDLKTYGPFEKGAVVRLPERHAEILISRNVAEKIKAEQ